MGPVGMQEMVVILLVALVLFGPKKLPELGKNLAKAMGEFRRAQTELKATFDREMQNLERETAALREEAHKTTAEIASYADSLAGTSSTYGSNYGANSAIPPSTVGASEVSSAELHAAELHASYPTLHDVATEASLEVSQGFPQEPLTLTSSEGTVARGALTEPAPASAAVEAEANPLPEFGNTAESGTKPASSELPSLV
jgi:TatA/E family protein of Tat protein translocase